MRPDSPRSIPAPCPRRRHGERRRAKGVGVAVIDTGIDGRLPDFSAADGTSRVVASAVTNPDATTALDTYGHGTHVAGIIAGDGNRRLERSAGTSTSASRRART